MTDRDPDVWAMLQARNDQERARILRSAPLRPLLLYQPVFSAACAAAGFDLGVAYLDALSDAFRARRHRAEFGTMRLDGLTMDINHVADGEGV